MTKKLTVKGRYLAYEDGAPFFYLADTAWEMLHRLSREEIDWFLAQRARQGFTAVQTVLLAELEGVTVPNYYGRLPLAFTNDLPDPARPDTEGENNYWAHVDYALEKAASLGLYLTLLPTWGDKYNLKWGTGPEIFTPENAEIYGRWLGKRYKNVPNIIWMLGGDRPLETAYHRRIIDAMAKGIRAEDTVHLMTFHPSGCATSIDFVGDAEYIDFHTAQTGHDTHQCYRSDAIMGQMHRATDKPFMDSECRYEDHPACFRPELGYFWTADDVRQNFYWNVLSGACGQTYGNHAVWMMNPAPTGYCPYTWRENVCHPGAEQAKHVKTLRLSRDYFSLRPVPELLCGNYEGMGHMVSAMGDGYAYVYLPLGLPVTVDVSLLCSTRCVRALWFNPRTGEETLLAILNGAEKTTLVPPAQGQGNDWVLILEKAE